MSKRPTPGGQPQLSNKDINVRLSDINFHVHYHDPGIAELKVAIQSLTDDVKQLKLQLKQGVDKLMALSQESIALIEKFDGVSTTIAGSIAQVAEAQVEIAADIKTLIEGATGEGAAELRDALGPKVVALEEAAAALKTSADFLTQLGADTNAPIPPLPPVEPPVDPTRRGRRG